jgi:hypothetical protein
MDVTVRVMSIALRHRKSSTARDVDPKPSWSGGDERLGLGVKMGAPAKRWDVNDSLQKVCTESSTNNVTPLRW